MNYAERAKYCANPAAKQLFRLMEEKETNLAVNCDVSSSEQLLRFADAVGPSICILKTHVDLLEDFSFEFIQQLRDLAKKHRFLIFEDRKFADIGAISKQQYRGGLYKIVEWAHLTNCHALPGPGIIQGLKEAGLPHERGLLLLAQMSSSGSLAKGEYTAETVAMAKECPEFVIGFICQEKLTDDPRFLHLTPGVSLSSQGDSLGQQYNTPEIVLGERGSDIMIVGRGISEAKDPAKEAERYRKAGRAAYIYSNPVNR